MNNSLGCLVPMLKLQRKPWFEDGQLLAVWHDDSWALPRQTLPQLYAELKPYLKAFCTHVKGNGGVKGTVRWLMAQLKNFQFGARFDVESYYQSIRKSVLWAGLKKALIFWVIIFTRDGNYVHQQKACVVC